MRCVTRIGIILITGLASVTVVAEQGYSCEELLNFKAEYEEQLPLQVDGFATLNELNIDCSSNTVEYVKKLKIDEQQLAKGFRERKQKQYQKLHCSKEGVAINGWTSIDRIYDKHGQPLVELIAKPSNCSNNKVTNAR